MGRPRNTDTRRAEIVGGLARVMAQRGYAGASVAAIAAEAQLATGLVHYHFARKQDILLALVADLAAQILRRFEAHRAEAAEPLVAAVDALLGTDAGDPVAAACWAWIGAEAHGLPEVGAAYSAALAQVHDGLKAAFVEAGAADPTLAARALLLAIEGAWRVGHGAPSLLPAGSAAPTLRALARALVTA